MSIQILNWSAMSILNKETLSSFFEQHSHKRILPNFFTQRNHQKCWGGTKTKWGILLRICWHKCQWLSKVGFKKHWSITKFSFIRWRLYELMLMRPSVWLDIFWHKAPTHKVHKLNGGATGGTQTLQLWSTQGLPQGFVRLASTKIIFSALVR